MSSEATPTAPPPPAHFVAGNTGDIPAAGLAIDASGVPQSTDQEAVVQNFGSVIKTEAGEEIQPFFEYSRCSGNKKALLVGINYIGTNNELRGCINDVKNVHKLLVDVFKYPNDQIIILTDDNKNPALKTHQGQHHQEHQVAHRRCQARRLALLPLASPSWQCWDTESVADDSSGHGTQVKDRVLDETDGKDEAICPLDFKTAGLLIDDERDHEILVTPLPAGARLTTLFDSCNSGTILDIPYIYQPDRVIVQDKGLFGSIGGILGNVYAGPVGGTVGAIAGNAVDGILDTVINKKSLSVEEKAVQVMNEAGAAPADVICWSGCLDDQTAADTFENGQSVGALSYAFITAIVQKPNQSYIELLVSIRKILKQRYSQIVQLSACHPIDVNLQFVV